MKLFCSLPFTSVAFQGFIWFLFLSFQFLRGIVIFFHAGFVNRESVSLSQYLLLALLALRGYQAQVSSHLEILFIQLTHAFLVNSYYINEAILLILNIISYYRYLYIQVHNRCKLFAQMTKKLETQSGYTKNTR